LRLGLVECKTVEFVHVDEPTEEPLPAAGGYRLRLGFVVGDDDEVDYTHARLAPWRICSHRRVGELVPGSHVSVVGLLRNGTRPDEVQPEPPGCDGISWIPERGVRLLVGGHGDVDGREAVVLATLRVDTAGSQSLKDEP